MNKWGVIGVTLLVVALVSGAGFADGGNLSSGRGLGIGVETEFPWGGLVSARYWFTPTIGAEGVVFAWGNPSAFTGAFTGRILYRIADTDTVDFYLAGGASALVSSPGDTTVIFSGVGGIEFSFPFAPNLAVNLEFGGAFSTTKTLTMAFGTGIHFYF